MEQLIDTINNQLVSIAHLESAITACKVALAMLTVTLAVITFI